MNLLPVELSESCLGGRKRILLAYPQDGELRENARVFFSAKIVQQQNIDWRKP